MKPRRSHWFGLRAFYVSDLQLLWFAFKGPRPSKPSHISARHCDAHDSHIYALLLQGRMHQENQPWHKMFGKTLLSTSACLGPKLPPIHLPLTIPHMSCPPKFLLITTTGLAVAGYFTAPLYTVDSITGLGPQSFEFQSSTGEVCVSARKPTQVKGPRASSRLRRLVPDRLLHHTSCAWLRRYHHHLVPEQEPAQWLGIAQV